MRRTFRLLGVTVLTGAALGVAPATDAAAGSTASLTVVMLDRTGHAVAQPVNIENRSTFETRWITSGHASRVPKGTYDVLADVFDTHEQSDTLAMTRASVTGTKRVTIDARRGRPVRLRLSPALPKGYEQTFTMGICQIDGPAEVEAFTYGAALYLVPSSLPEAQVGITSTWRNDPGPRYVVNASARRGVPAGITRTVRQSSLATIDVSARSGPVSGLDGIDIRGQGNGLCPTGVADTGVSDYLPFSFVTHVSPGTWQFSASGQEKAGSALLRYRGGHSYHVTINRAAWGPEGELPYTSGGRRIYLGTFAPFADSSLPLSTEANLTYTLTRGGHVVLRHSSRGEVWSSNFALPTSGWYTLTESAKRHPAHALAARTLSIASSVVLRFHADAEHPTQARGYLTLFRPQGLTGRNLAHPGSRTAVLLPLQRQRPSEGDVRQLPDSVRSVRLLYTVDGGAHWHSAPVHKSGSSFAASITNPRSGYVGLKSTVTDTHGGYTTTTVLRAYGIG